MPDATPQPGQLVIDMHSDGVRHITIRAAGELDLATVDLSDLRTFSGGLRMTIEERLCSTWAV